jgi:hypothetical protein
MYNSLPKAKDTVQCYANLAVGSYSRPCRVHRNFKLIVHIPKSALLTTPPAFLNRFEKYCVSIEQALSQKLRQIDWEPVRIMLNICFFSSHLILGARSWRRWPIKECTNSQYYQRGMRRYAFSIPLRTISKQTAVSQRYMKCVSLCN